MYTLLSLIGGVTSLVGLFVVKSPPYGIMQKAYGIGRDEYTRGFTLYMNVDQRVVYVLWSLPTIAYIVVMLLWGVPTDIRKLVTLIAIGFIAGAPNSQLWNYLSTYRTSKFARNLTKFKILGESVRCGVFVAIAVSYSDYSLLPTALGFVLGSAIAYIAATMLLPLFKPTASQLSKLAENRLHHRYWGYWRAATLDEQLGI